MHVCWIEIIDTEKNEAVAVRFSDVLELNIEQSLYIAADSFDVTLKNDLLLSDYLRKEQEISFWIGFTKNLGGWTKDELMHVFTGKIDGVRPRFGNEMTVQLVGRDFAARLIDTEFSIAFAERTASDIATILAEKHSLTPEVTATTLVIEKDLYKDRKEWAILQELADREGFVCYIKKNKTLYFGPRKDTDETVVAELYYKQKEKSNILEIEFDDSLVGVINYVVVRHWMGRKKQLIQGEAKNEELIKKYGEKKRVVYDPKAKTTELANEMAAKKLKEWSRIVVTADQVQLPCAPYLECEKMVSITGCGRFDGKYYIERVRHQYNKSGWFTEANLTSQRPDSAAQYRQDLYDDHEKKM